MNAINVTDQTLLGSKVIYINTDNIKRGTTESSYLVPIRNRSFENIADYLSLYQH
jgi:hypothetical protein